MQTMYGTDKAADLTDSQKQNIANLSHIAAGLAGGVVGDSTRSFISGAEIGKRAVENNLLSKEEDDYIFESSAMFNKDGSLNEKRKYKTQQLLIKSKEIDLLLQQYQKDPTSLNEAQINYLHNELVVISNSYGIPLNKLYGWDFNSGYKRDDASLSNYLAGEYYRQYLSYEAKQGKSLTTGILTLPVASYGYRFVPELGKFVLANPIKSETAVVVGYKSGKLVGEDKVFVNDKFNQQGVEDIGKDVVKTIALGRLSWWQQGLYGTAIDYGYEVNKHNATTQSVKAEMIGSYAGTGVSGLVELGTMAVPKFSGTSKIFGSTIFSDVASDNAKAVYSELEKQNKNKGSEK